MLTVDMYYEVRFFSCTVCVTLRSVLVDICGTGTTGVSDTIYMGGMSGQKANILIQEAKDRYNKI